MRDGACGRATRVDGNTAADQARGGACDSGMRKLTKERDW
jgi:hypothetical protein